MTQVVVYGHSGALRPRIPQLSEGIHAAAVKAFQLPASKRFHRFIPLEPECFLAPSDGTDDYTIIEVSMFEGRSTESKKAFLREVYRCTTSLGLRLEDVEITITETPRQNWGIRGLPGDELDFPYPVNV